MEAVKTCFGTVFADSRAKETDEHGSNQFVGTSEVENPLSDRAVVSDGCLQVQQTGVFLL
jgi:hypothetical protein